MAFLFSLSDMPYYTKKSAERKRLLSAAGTPPSRLAENAKKRFLTVRGPKTTFHAPKRGFYMDFID
jgi:hypothetical protein